MMYDLFFFFSNVAPEKSKVTQLTLVILVLFLVSVLEISLFALKQLILFFICNTFHFPSSL